MEERTIAIYLDFENLALSAETVYSSKEKPLAMGPLVDFASAKGLICVKKAYADWSREIFSQYQNRLMEQGFELVHLPSATYQGKNGCDVRLAVDVMEYLQLHPGIHRVLIGSGDTDFIPLIQRLRARGKEVIILGFEHSVGALVKRNCNEFKSLEELLGGAEAGAPSGDLSPERLPGQGRQLLLRFIRSREEEEPLLLSALKQHLLRLDPAFSERELGFASFKDFLRSLEGDVVERFDQEQSALPLVYLRDQPEAPAEAGT